MRHAHTFLEHTLFDLPALSKIDLDKRETAPISSRSATNSFRASPCKKTGGHVAT
jgi:hypothetical protein